MSNEFENITEILNKETIVNDFVQTMQKINCELDLNGLYNVEYYLLMISTNISKDLSIKTYDELKSCILNYLNKYLLPNSETYNIIYNNSELLTLFTNYFSKLIEYYNKSYLLEHNRFDDYVKMNINTQNIDTLGFKMENIQNTMKLLNEAVRLYYEMYNNKTIIATFSDEQEIQFRIKEAELAHLLGIKFESMVKGEDGDAEKFISALNLEGNDKLIMELYIKLNKEKDKNKRIQIFQQINKLDPEGKYKISILHKFINTQSGNLFEYEEDRIKKVLKQSDYSIISPSSDIQLSQFYTKANIKSKAFIKFKPLEELSMLLSLPDGHELIKIKEKRVKNGEVDPSQYDVLVSKSNLSEQYQYTTLLNNLSRVDDRRYFESLLIKNPQEIQSMEQVQGSRPAITTKVVIEPDNGTFGSTKEKIFSEEKQKEFIRQVYEDFKKVDFTELIKYFKNLEQGYNINSSRNKRL